MSVTYGEIPELVGYRIGDDGSVWSCRKPGRPRDRFSPDWHRLADHVGDHGGHRAISLRPRPGDKKARIFYVHRLVLEAFVGPCPEGMEGCHDDGDPANNRLDNLRWDTPKGNASDKYRHGTVCFGERHQFAALSDADVAEMRWLKAACPSLWFRSIAWLYGVKPAVASRSIQGKRRPHIPGAVAFVNTTEQRRARQVGLKHDYPSRATG